MAEASAGALLSARLLRRTTTRAEPLVDCWMTSLEFGRGRHAVTGVRHITCTVTRASRVVLKGRSGSGRSSLLRVLAGLEVPTRGVVRWASAGGMHDLERDSRPPPWLTVVPQTADLTPGLTVFEQVALGLGPGRLSGSGEAHVHRTLDRLGLGGLAARLPSRLSTGEARRVTVARALVGRPLLVLADEPTAHQGRSSAALVRAALEAAGGAGAALVVATNDPATLELPTQSWEMHEGRLRVYPGRSAGTVNDP